MRIFNQEKTEELIAQELDLALGRLENDRLLLAHHDAIMPAKGKTAAEILQEKRAQGIAVEEIDGKYYFVVATYDNGGKDVREIQDEPDTSGQAAYDEYEDIQVYIPYTSEEIMKRQNEQSHRELKEELSKIKEDIEQETFGLIRDDYASKKARAAEIVNALRVLEGKEPRAVKEANDGTTIQ